LIIRLCIGSGHPAGACLKDAIRILSSLFVGDATLPEPYPDEGPDPTVDGLGCVGF